MLHLTYSVRAIRAAGLACLVGITSALVGCVVGPDYRVPQPHIPDAWHQELDHGTYVSVEEAGQWWTILQDPVLDGLIATSGEQNLDLYAAFQRIEQARAQVAIAQSARLFDVDGLGSYQNSRKTLNGQSFAGVPFMSLNGLNLWALGCDFSWELDVFGQVARNIEARSAGLQASEEAYRDIMVSLYADVARAYVQLRTQQQRLDIAARNLTVQQEACDLARKRFDGGIAPILDVHQAESNLAATNAEIPVIQQSIQQALNRLAVLLGEFPGSLHHDLLEPAPIPIVPDDLPTALPFDVVRQRPDIRQAERELAAHVAEIGIAEADLYPRFSLNGTFTIQARSVSQLFNSDGFGYGVGPAFRWAVFRAGEIRANIYRTNASANESAARYQQRLLLAGEEVENAIVAFQQESLRRDALRQAVDAAQRSNDSSLKLYNAGEVNFLNVLSSQRDLFVAQNQLAASEGQVLINLISFYEALGGGWDPAHHCVDRCVGLAEYRESYELIQ